MLITSSSRLWLLDGGHHSERNSQIHALGPTEPAAPLARRVDLLVSAGLNSAVLTTAVAGRPTLGGQTVGRQPSGLGRRLLS